MGNWVVNFTKGGTQDKKLMPQQARKLLRAGLWGVPDTAQAKEKLAVGDRVLVYVGAPDRIFVGDARIAAPWHAWTPDEAQRYAGIGTFGAGIALEACRVWDKPVALDAVWPDTQGAKTNPSARWYGAVTRLTQSDFDAILEAGAGASAPIAAATGTAPAGGGILSAPAPPAPATGAGPPAAGLPESDALFRVASRIQAYLLDPKPVNEDGTRAFFIDKWLDALGYREFDDIEHGSAVASGDYPDYVLRAGGKPVVAVEAKRIGHRLGPKEAAQIVKYASVLGLRWGLLTDGRCIQVFDVPVTGIPPEDRVVLSVDLADFADRDDFDSRIWPAASLLTKQATLTGAGLERHAARELIRTLLSTRRRRASRRS